MTYCLLCHIIAAAGATGREMRASPDVVPSSLQLVSRDRPEPLLVCYSKPSAARWEYIEAHLAVTKSEVL